MRACKSVARLAGQATLLLVLLSVLLPFSRPEPAKADAPQRIGRVRWGYYVTYDSRSLESVKKYISSLDYLSPWWLLINGAGDLTWQVKNDEKATVLALAKGKGVKVLPMVKNSATNSAFHDVLANPSTRAHAIQNIVSAVVDNGFDGINIDYEGIDGADRDALTTFMAELAPALRNKGKIVTMAVAAKNKERFDGWAGAYDYAALAPHNDLIVTMTYAYHSASSPSPGPTAPFAWVEAVINYTTEGIPASKLVLGLGLWGYDWDLTASTPAKSLTYPEAVAIAQANGAQFKYDDANKAVYFNYTSDGHQHEVWLEDRRSVDAKIDLLVKYNLAGGAAWRMGHEDPAVWEAYDARLGYQTWYFAEGSTAKPFETWILVQNPNATEANITVTFLKEDGTTVPKTYKLAPTSRFSIFANQVVPNAPGLATRIDADVPVFAERAMYFGHDGHDSTGINAPNRRWYLPEGFTGGQDTWVLLMNPNSSQAHVKVSFLKDDGTTVVREYDMRPTSRLNVFANTIVPNAAFSTLIEGDLPIVAERASYYDGGKGGHGSMGVTDASKRWYLAEGSTNNFDSWILMMNPGQAAANATITFMYEGGQTETKTYTLKPSSRTTVWANNTISKKGSFAARIEADLPIVVERAMYWAKSVAGHSATAATAPAQTWYLPEGSTGRPFDEWLLLANPGGQTANVRVTFMPESGKAFTRDYQVGATSRYTVHVNEVIPNIAVSIRVDADQPVVAERSMYWASPSNLPGGHNSTGIPQ